MDAERPVPVSAVRSSYQLSKEELEEADATPKKLAAPSSDPWTPPGRTGRRGALDGSGALDLSLKLIERSAFHTPPPRVQRR